MKTPPGMVDGAGGERDQQEELTPSYTLGTFAFLCEGLLTQSTEGVKRGLPLGITMAVMPPQPNWNGEQNEHCGSVSGILRLGQQNHGNC